MVSHTKDGMAKRTGLVARIPAGVTDAGMASLATFLTGLVGVNALDDVTRGVYAIFFTAFLAGTVIPTQLALLPAETSAVSEQPEDRLNSIGASTRIGLVIGPVALLPTVIALIATAGRTEAADIFALAVTAGIAAIVSPLQDHVRRMLHLAGFSWRAAATSGVQLGGVLAGLGIAYLVNVPTAWIPLGVLAAANTVSLGFGLITARNQATPDRGAELALVTLARAGRWLLVMALAPTVANFAASLIIAGLAGPEAIGYAEAARLAAQPLYVLGLGLEAAVRPHAMTAASEKDRAAARQHRRVYYPVVLGITGLFILWCGFDWVGNPFGYLVPAAYEVAGLVIVTALASAMRSMLLPYLAELLGARAERRLATVAIRSAPLQVVAALTAGLTGAFARPLGGIVDYSARLVAHETWRDRIYRDPRETAPA